MIRWLYHTKFQYPETVDEVHLLELDKTRLTGQYLETCYRQEPGQFGWCRTQGNFYNSSVDLETRIATDWGWGFCTSECKQDLREKEKGVLRSLDTADILREGPNPFFITKKISIFW